MAKRSAAVRLEERIGIRNKREGCIRPPPGVVVPSESVVSHRGAKQGEERRSRAEVSHVSPAFSLKELARIGGNLFQRWRQPERGGGGGPGLKKPGGTDGPQGLDLARARDPASELSSPASRRVQTVRACAATITDATTRV